MVRQLSDPDWESVVRVHFHRATAGAFWIWDQSGQGAPRSTTETAALNWLGSFSGSAQKVFQTAFTSIGDMDSQYRDLSPSARLEKLLNQQEAFDPQMAGMVADTFFDAPDSAWQRGKIPTWGNDQPSKYPDLQVKYQFGNFNIYGPKIYK